MNNRKHRVEGNTAMTEPTQDETNEIIEKQHVDDGDGGREGSTGDTDTDADELDEDTDDEDDDPAP